MNCKHKQIQNNELQAKDTQNYSHTVIHMTTVIPGLQNCLNPADNLKGWGWGTTGDTLPPRWHLHVGVKNKTERKPEDNRGVSSEYWNKNTVKPEFYIQWKHLSKMNQSYTSHINYKWILKMINWTSVKLKALGEESSKDTFKKVKR